MGILLFLSAPSYRLTDVAPTLKLYMRSKLRAAAAAATPFRIISLVTSVESCATTQVQELQRYDALKLITGTSRIQVILFRGVQFLCVLVRFFITEFHFLGALYTVGGAHRQCAVCT